MWDLEVECNLLLAASMEVLSKMKNQYVAEDYYLKVGKELKTFCFLWIDWITSMIC